MRSPSLVALLFALAVAACRPAPDPEPLSPALRSLRAPDYDPDHGLEYWTRRLDERRSDREWDRAVAFCREDEVRQYPNCRTVELLHTASQVPGFPREEALP
jgi:hypothetical protein